MLDKKNVQTRFLVLSILGMLSFLLTSPGEARVGNGSHRVRPHVNRNGVYVPPHSRTNPRMSKPRNNWSSQGNVNPNNGRKGSKSRFN